jgi:hypothetical protein
VINGLQKSLQSWSSQELMQAWPATSYLLVFVIPVPINCRPLTFTLVPFVAYSSSILLVDTTCSSETSLNVQRTSLRYIPQYNNFHNHRFDNLNSCCFKVLTAISWLSHFHSFAATQCGRGRCCRRFGGSFFIHNIRNIAHIDTA